MLKSLALAVLFISIAGCAEIQQYDHMSESVDIPLSVSLGTELYRIKKTRDLPNVFGKADIWGGKINEGYTELRFMGFTPNGGIIFRLTDMDIESNESVFTRYGVNRSVVNSNTTGNVRANVTSYGNTAYGTAYGQSNTRTTISHHDKPEATITQLPANTIEFVFDPKDVNLTLGNITIEILEVKEYSIVYVLHKQQ